MINTIDNPEMVQYLHKVLNQYVKKDHLRTTMVEHAAKVNERFAANEQMIMTNANKFNELLMRHELTMVNTLNEKTNHAFWKFTKLSLAMITTGLMGGAGAVLFILDSIDNVRLEIKDDINKLDTKMNELDKKIDTKMNELDKKIDTKMNELDKKLDILLMKSNK